MVGSTRSGRILNNQGTRLLRSRSGGVKVKSSDTFGSIGSGSSRRRIIDGNSKETKSSIPSDSAPADSSRLRLSSGERPLKTMETPCPIGIRKSARLNSQSSIISLDKSKLGKVDNKRPVSPLRRSERIEKHETSNCPGSRKSNWCSSSVDMEKRKNGNTSGQTSSVGMKIVSNGIELGAKSGGVLKKKKRLDARTYRAYMNPPTKKVKSSDSGRVHEEDGASPKSINTGVKDSGELREGGDECSRRKEVELCEDHSSENCKEVMVGSNSSSGELADMILGDERHTEPTIGNVEQSYCVDSANELKYEDRFQLSKSSDNSLGSSINGTIANEADGADVKGETDALDSRTEDCCLATEDLGTPELMNSTSFGGSRADVVDEGNGVEVGGSENSVMAADANSDILVTPSNDKISVQQISTTETTMLLSERNKMMEQCTGCSELQRMHIETQANKLCSCAALTKCEMSTSCTKDACKLVAKSPSSFTDGTVICSSHEEEAQEREDVSPRVKDQLVKFEKQNSVCLVALLNGVHVFVPVTEDTRKSEANNETGIAEEHHNSASMEESLLSIQSDVCPNACVICKHPGFLLCCDGRGCRRSYHLSCLDPPLQDVPHGVWLCPTCVKKKLESGVYSVSKGMESVWSVKEDMLGGKEYLIKYKGLAHVHNRWIPESQMLIEAPMLLAKFNKRYQKEKVIRWKQEWAEPQRLLQKRLLMPRNLADEFFSQHSSNLLQCYSEWLVKWKGLGYEHASWELENSPFLCSSEAVMLRKDYEKRCDEAKQKSDPLRADKALQVKNCPFHKLSKLPDGFPPKLDNDHLSCINRIREYWHRSQNALLIDDQLQERIIKSVLFILALQSCTCRPFLVISSINSLSSWETEFMHLAPSINVILYSGNKDVRKMIRTLEFYEEGGCLMFQVLLSHPEAIVEDFDVLSCIGWESIIVDECQNPRMSKHFELFNNLSSDFRLILLSGQLKDSLIEYVNLLSFLDSGGKENCVNSLESDSNDNVGMFAIIKERLARYIAYERKSDSSKFVEYWVPVCLSNVQLEQYCATLILNSIALRSCSKTDHVGALRDIVISTRKCCDHPYLVDQSLQSALTKGLPAVEYLNVGVNASGKLLLLDKILQQIRNQGLRVVILFQSIGGAGRNKMGDFLDDFLRQRFGVDSYERVDSGLIMSKKVSALNKFNDKTMGRFVFLIENRACLPSIKLSSVDAVIIYDSDWNPLNDLKALQRISIESHFDRVKVFRLYTSYTVEEKVLIFAKQDLILESNIQNISPSVSHSLLGWGASYLFNKLDEFHQNNNSTIGLQASLVNSPLDDVAQELLKELQNNDAISSTRNCSVLIKALQSGASYSRNILLVGEKEGITSLDVDLPSFWTNLLDGKYPQWRFISGPSQRSRRKLPYSDQSSDVPEMENDEVKRKRKKVAKDTVDPISLQSWLHDKRKAFEGDKDAMVPENSACSGTFNRPSLISPRKAPFLPSWVSKETEAPKGSQHLSNSAHTMGNNYPTLHNTPGTQKSHEVESEGRKQLRNAQRKLHLLLRPELLKLCELMRLPVVVQDMAEKFLEYIMNNHHVNQEPETILQAFKIALCWRAATFLKHKVDHKETIVLAKNCLNFECSEEQALSVYSKLRILKRKFCNQTAALKNDIGPHYLDKASCMPIKEDIDGPSMRRRISQSVTSVHPELEEGELRDTSALKNDIGPHYLDKPLCIPGKEDIAGLSMHEGTSQSVTFDHPELEAGELRDTGALNNDFGPDYLDKPSCMPSKEDITGPSTHERISQSVTFDHPELEEGELRDIPGSQRCSDRLNLEQENDPVLGIPLKPLQEVGSLMDMDLNNRVEIDKICSDRMKKVLLKQQLECTEFDRKKVEEKEKLQKTYNQALDHIHSLDLDSAAADDKIKVLDQGFSKKLDGFEEHMKCQRLRLSVLQIKARNKERQIKDQWLNAAKAGILSESFDDLPLSDSGFRFEEFKVREQVGASDCSRDSPHLPRPSYPQCSDLTTKGALDSTESREQSDEILEIVPNGEVVIPRENSPDSQLNSMDLVQPFEPNNSQIPESVLQGGVENSPTETEPQASLSGEMNAVDDIPEGIVNPGTADTADNEHHVTADNSDGACLISSPLRSQMELPSSSPVSTSSMCENSALPTQVHLLRNHERPLMSIGLESDQHISSPQQSVAPALHSAGLPSQAEGTAIQLNLCSGVDEALVHQESMPTTRGSEQEPCSQMLGSTQQSETSMQQPIGIAGDVTRIGVSESRSHLHQLFSMTTWIPPQGLHPDPLENELTRLQKQQDTCNKMHEEKKHRLKLEYEQEIEKVRRKYEALLQNVETELLQEKENIGTIYSKVLMNRNLAEEFRTRFIDHKGGNSATLQGLRSSSLQQFHQPSQPPPAQRPASCIPTSLASVSVAAAATLPPTPNLASFPPARIHASISALPSVSSSQMVPQAPAVFLSNPARPQLSPLLPPRTNIQVGSEPRAPAPHLQRFRSQMSMSALDLPQQPALILGQQQPLARLGSPSSSLQVSPVLPSCTSGASSSGISQASASGIMQTEASVTLPWPSNVGDSHVGASQPTLSPLGDMAPAFENWLATNLALPANGLPTSSIDPTRSTGASGAAVDVICIDD